MSMLDSHDRTGPAAAAPVDAMRPRRYRIGRTRQDTRDTFTLNLDPVDGPPMQYTAGQFTMLDALEHTIRDVGVVTHALIAAPVGTLLGVRGPYGTSWDMASAVGGDVVFVVGGIGLAPLRPAICELIAHRDRYDRVVLLYGVRTPEDILFGDELRTWAHDHGVVVEVTVDNGQHAWRGKVGLVTQLIPRAGFDPRNTTAFVCGPEVMMRFSAVALADRGVRERRIRMSMERNMKCGVGLCGHCQLRELFICVDGPVLTYDRLAPLLSTREM